MIPTAIAPTGTTLLSASALAFVGTSQDVLSPLPPLMVVAANTILHGCLSMGESLCPLPTKNPGAAEIHGDVCQYPGKCSPI